MEEIKSYSTGNDSLKRIGNFIKEARLSRNQSIEELASNLKIGEHQLKAIEEGDEDALPEEVFVKAMVRRISDKLKLDTKFIMGEFDCNEKNIKIEKNDSTDEIDEKVSPGSKKETQVKNRNYLGFLIFITISGVFGLLASSLIFNFFSESFQNPTPSQELIKKN